MSCKENLKPKGEWSRNCQTIQVFIVTNDSEKFQTQFLTKRKIIRLNMHIYNEDETI